MSENRIADLFHVSHRFLRSAHLERDFQDPSGLSGYIPTDFTRSCLSRILPGLKQKSGQRAWRVTGDYGSGKSSFALLIAHLFAGHKLPSHLQKVVDFQHIGVSRPSFIPILVTCTRQTLGISILKSIQLTLTRILNKQNIKSKFVSEIQHLLDSNSDPTEDQVIQFIIEINSWIISKSLGKGLLLILDELGKFLEFASHNSQRQDVFLLQRLAEMASRSEDKPLFLICLLHQGFHAYSDLLSQTAQREWEKVAGRFEEIVFNQPVEQVANIIASAMNVNTAKIPKAQILELKQAMEVIVDLGWFGSASKKALFESVTQLYPLHPTVLPVLIRIFQRFGQNERSLFSFLFSNEPFGLQSFSEKLLTKSEPYRLWNFYDYVRTNFGHRLIGQSYRSHWKLIESIIESFTTEDEIQIKILKTVGILNLLNDGDLLPTQQAVCCALKGTDPSNEKQVITALEKLKKFKRVIYDRGRARGLCLWPHTSVDLEKAYEDSGRAVDMPKRVANYIKDSLESRPVVARRHYIETGNLRYCDIHYCSVTNLPSLLDISQNKADGLIIIPLCETEDERLSALQFATQPFLKDCLNTIVAVPRPLDKLASLVHEVQRWEWISIHTPELNGDKFAREEVSRQKEALRMQLEKRIQDYIGFKQLVGETMLEWFHQGVQKKIKNGRELLSLLSDIFDETYNLAPQIQNELANRRNLSSAGAAARMRLIERMLLSADSECLGMNSEKKPPEMSMYLSVLKKTGLHQKFGEIWRITEPGKKIDPSKVLPTLLRIKQIVQAIPDSRINVASLFSELCKPPYGVREGLLPIFLTVFYITNEKNVAFYKDGSFLRELNAETMLVLTKVPERFDIQFCKIEGVRTELFEKLISALDIQKKEKPSLELLDIVKNLCVFIAQLPAYVLNTKRLSPIALAVRDSILNAQEPAKLLFTDLPQACGLKPISSTTTTDRNSVQSFVKIFKSALDELRAAFPELQERLRQSLRSAFNFSGSFQTFRTSLASVAEEVVLNVTETKLRAFCLRLMDDSLPESDWLESIGSYLALKPPSKWHDAEDDLFASELAQLATKFHRVESIIISGGKTSKNATGIRIAITQANGVEYEQVLHFNSDEEQQLLSLQEQFESILKKNNRLGLAAVSRAIWTKLESQGKVKT